MRAIPALGLVATCTIVAILSIILNPVEAQPSAAAKYVEGTHYQRINTPVKTTDENKIEVTEVFWYGCGHCNQFRPIFEAWKKQQSSDVNIQHSPAIWNKSMIVHAHIYYTAKALRLLDKGIHKDVFNAMHQDKKKLTSPKQIFPLFERYGITQETFDKTFDSFGVKSQVQQASARARGYGITGTPEVIVNGKYRISGRMVRTQAEVLKVASFLVKKERATK